MDPNFSNCYPPRASDRWIPKVWSQALDRIYLRVKWDRFFDPLSTSLSLSKFDLILGALIPGYGYSLVGQRRLGQLMLSGWVVCGLLLVMFLAPSFTGYLLIAMTSCHANGAGTLWVQCLKAIKKQKPSLAFQILISLVCFGLYLVVLYQPALKGFQNTVASSHRLVSLNASVLINPRVAAFEVKRGDFIAFRHDEYRGAREELNLILRSGLNTGRVLALPGDRIEFNTHSVRINGHSLPRKPSMPTEGKLVLHRETWFVWPTVQYDRLDPMRFAVVDQSSLVGRAYDQWFFLKQNLP